MNDTQTWTLIGGFLAVMVAMTGMVLRVVRAEIRVLMFASTGSRAGSKPGSITWTATSRP